MEGTKFLLISVGCRSGGGLQSHPTLIAGPFFSLRTLFHSFLLLVAVKHPFDVPAITMDG